MKTERYDIGGMHCAACSSAIERVTRKLAGVQHSEVNLPMNRLTITYDEAECSPEAIIKKVQRAGFTAALHTDAPKETTAQDDETQAAAQLRRQKISLVAEVGCAGVLLVISMGQMLFANMPMPDIISMNTHPTNFALVQLLLTIPVLLLGKRFFVGGFGSLAHGNPNMDSLVAISASASFLYSLVMTFFIPDNAHAVHSLYYESAAVVVALVSVGKYLEASSKEKTKDSIQKLMNLTPDTALLVDANGQWEVPVEMVKVGDTVLVKPGAKVPLDGTVTEGHGSINEAMLTGESLPVEKAAGAQVIGGSVSVDGALYVQVTHVGKDTALSKIIQFVEDAQGKKAPISRTADAVAGVFVPVVIAIAVVAGGLWWAISGDFSFALKIFTSILVIACPCAMGLATPTAIIVGTGLGANNGILIRNGEALEITHGVSTVIFDKTGTITEGKPSVTEVVSQVATEAEVLRAALALEQMSEHPLSKAICDAAARQEITAPNAQQFENITGRGLRGIDEAGAEILVGNLKLMQEHSLAPDAYLDAFEAGKAQGKTVVFVAKAGQVLGIIAMADTLKAEAKSAIAQLHGMGIQTVLLTGDNAAAAHFIAAQVGIDEVVAEVLPTEKSAVVQRYQQGKQGKQSTVMMVGDGINDAPALTQADIGCAIGNGSDIAIDSAEVVLMKSDIRDVPKAIALSKATIRNIKQNLFWAFIYNVCGIPVAAGVLYPTFGLLLSPMIGGLAMSLSSLFVVSNALRLKGTKL